MTKKQKVPYGGKKSFSPMLFKCQTVKDKSSCRFIHEKQMSKLIDQFCHVNENEHLRLSLLDKLNQQ